MNFVKTILLSMLLVGCVTQSADQKLKMEDIRVGDKLISAQDACDLTVANLMTAVPTDPSGGQWVPLSAASHGQTNGMVCGLVHCNKDGRDMKQFDCGSVEAFKKKQQD